ncbi:hypothetical protein DPMN_014508 [Dreissena polymorpha]|uniref:RNase H type-1 domain-containing protein n=1 Tax=Dreissena polymorpha TaxID=45954 RepID=A0A9D4NBU9_DREPO|nr:hypothetical protein DPMN_014508 [Dreissena polymorpha]
MGHHVKIPSYTLFTYVSRPDILTSILELHQQCLDKSLKVTLEWCPAHVNISGNEQADRGAKEGLLRGAYGWGTPGTY